jgi:energy-coupling factor transporter transmembrane protein EcfT
MTFVFPMLILIVFGTLSIPFAVLYLVGVFKKRRWMKWVGGLCTAGILLIAVSAVGFLLYGFFFPNSDTTKPEKIRATFKSNFGFEPGADFVPLNQRMSGYGDWYSLHLQFRASAETRERMRQLGFQATDCAQFADQSRGQAPTWWIQTPSGACYENHKWKGPLESASAYFHYDPASDSVFFFVVSVE